ncbi:MAG: hydrogenase maturation protease [Caldiserica bacterium]|nr:hydrogenase maturation protease [Caldisericota bacterium]
MRILVVGYGNPIRRDDAVGLWIAGRLSGRPDVETVSAWPFTPELIARLAGADLVIFVDADVRPGPIRWRRVRPVPTAVLSHSPEPGELLAWAVALFGREPEAWLVTVPGRDFSFGEGLSRYARSAAERVIRRIERLLASA